MDRDDALRWEADLLYGEPDAREGKESCWICGRYEWPDVMVQREDLLCHVACADEHDAELAEIERIERRKAA